MAGPTIGALAALGGPHVPFLVASAIAGGNAVVALRRLPETSRSGSQPTPAPAPRRASVGPIVLAFVALCAFSAFEATFALFGERRLGLRLASTGAVFAGVGLVLVLVQSVLVRPLVARQGERGTLRLGLALNAVGLLALAGTRTWLALVPALLALTTGQGLAMPALTATVAARADPRRRGSALGLQQSAGGLARVVGPLAGGVAFDRIGVPAPYLAGAVLMAGCALAVRATGPTPSAGGVP